MKTSILPQLVTIAEVAKSLTISSATLWRYEQLPDFLPAIQLGPKRVAYRLLDIENWIGSKIVK